ncbi:MAG: hypothetical protein RIB52_10505 [Erythrobacter sp.]|uniref:hypothetical protein n=1 Tax=Erythrobacter sp. TaxID=1042 RepID=UPI0032EA91F5
MKEVDLRDVWKSEPNDFTPWLAEPENLQFLADSLELPGLELIRTEHPVESFSADIVCKIIDTDHFVLIENQLEKSDHMHVGQILTYAAKFDARIIVWVAQKFTEAHRAALDWLNDISADRYGFFGVEIRAVKIGESDVAPLFDVVAKPNEWTKPETISGAKRAELSEENMENIEFWNQIDDELEKRGKIQRKIKKEVKGTNLWIPISSDGSVYIVLYRALSGTARVGVYLGIYSEYMPYYSSRLRSIPPESICEAIRGGKWTMNAKQTVDSYQISPMPMAGKDQGELVGWLVDRANDLAEAFLQPTIEAQQSKPSVT